MKEGGPTAAEIIAIYDEVRGYFRTPQAIKGISPEKEEKLPTKQTPEQVQDKTSPKK
ncbi:MAG TPA: hypothetical protein VMY36_02980 [Patescibacteria group bacterium]|nr:hypothetical protein [Patescibacteria group bacterium]